MQSYYNYFDLYKLSYDLDNKNENIKIFKRLKDFYIRGFADLALDVLKIKYDDIQKQVRENDFSDKKSIIIIYNLKGFNNMHLILAVSPINYNINAKFNYEVFLVLDEDLNKDYLNSLDLISYISFFSTSLTDLDIIFLKDAELYITCNDVIANFIKMQKMMNNKTLMMILDKYIKETYTDKVYDEFYNYLDNLNSYIIKKSKEDK